MPRNNSRGGRNNNPQGRNQYSDWGVMDMARERPIAAAAAAAGAAAAGLFLWSKRNQISDQMSNLSDQIGEWTENMGSGDGELRIRRRHRRPRPAEPSSSASRGMSETGGGNASLGARSGGAGTLDDGQRPRPARHSRRRSAIATRRGAFGRPFSMRRGSRAIASPNSGLVTELMCVPGTSSKHRVGKHVGELLGRAVVVVLAAAHDQRRHGEGLAASP